MKKVSFKILFWTGFGFDGKFNFTNFSKKMMGSAFFSVFAAVRLLVNNENEKLENENG